MFGSGEIEPVRIGLGSGAEILDGGDQHFFGN